MSPFSELPNLHPAVVHFPIVLLPLAVLADFVCLARRREGFWERLATGLYLLGALAAALAVRTGKAADESLVGLAPHVQPHIGEHSDWAHRVLYIFGVLAALRLLVAWQGRRVSGAGLRLVRFGVMLAAFLGCLVLLKTAELGGALVFRYGVGVAPESRAVAVGSEESLEEELARLRSAEPAEPAESRLVEADDGSVLWQPLPHDRDAVGSLLRPGPGASVEAVSVLEPQAVEGRGLGLRVEGRTLLLLPGTFGDVQVEAELALVGFEGLVGLAHHVRSATEGRRFTVSVPSGEAFLTGDRGKTLGRGVAQLPTEPFRLAVSAAGRHVKGMLDGKTVVHGHEPAPPAGGCGLYLDGRGKIRILSIRIVPSGG